MRDAYLLTRLMYLYSAAVRIPLIRAFRSHTDVEKLEVTVVLGVVGDEKSYLKRVGQILPTLKQTFTDSFAKFKKVGVPVPKAPINIEIIGSDLVSPIFGIADLFGWIGHRLCASSSESQTEHARAMYELAKPILTRAPFSENEKYPGIMFSSVE